MARRLSGPPADKVRRLTHALGANWRRTVRALPEPGESANGRLSCQGRDKIRGPRASLTTICGAKLGDIPIEQPTKFKMVLNLETAKALGVEVSAMLLAGADEAIE